MSLDISPTEIAKWLDLVANLSSQPLSVILIVVVAIQWYALYRLAGSYLMQGIRNTRLKLVLAFNIMEKENIMLKEAEGRVDDIAYKGKPPENNRE